MRAPMAWIAVGLAGGSAVWIDVGWQVGLAALLSGVLLRVFTAHPTSWIAFGVGIGVCNGHLQQPMLPATPHIAGRVHAASGRHAMVASDAGKYWIKTAAHRPVVGEWMSARVAPLNPAPELPGAWPTHRRATLANAPQLRAREWVSADIAPPADPASNRRRRPAVLRALLTGDRTGLSEQTKAIFRNTGTTHLLAISGLHVGVAATFGAAVGWVSGRPLVLAGWVHLARIMPHLFGMAAAVYYAQRVGWPVSTQRAVCMVGAAAVATLAGRRVDPWQVVGLAAVAILIRDPSAVASLGFILSFGAVVALIGWTPVFAGRFGSTPRPVRWIGQSLAATLSATIGTLPILAWAFQQVALSAPVANLIAVPLIAGIAVPLGLLGTVTDSDGLVEAADITVDGVMRALSALQWGAVHPAVGPAGAALLGAGAVMFRTPRLALLIGLVALTPPQRSTDTVVTFPDIGQGGAALIEFSDGQTWLVDGGPPGRRLLHWLRRRGVRTIDLVVISHPDADHFGGLAPVLSELRIGQLWAPRRPRPTEDRFHDLWRDAHQRRIPCRVIGTPAGVSDNEGGIVVTVRDGRHSFLISGDIGQTTEQRVAKHVAPVSVVQVPHHGSKHSSSPELVAATRPIWAVIQSGRGNRYGHPHPAAVERWKDAAIAQTRLLGTVQFRTDGIRLGAAHWVNGRGWVPLEQTREPPPDP